MYSNDLLAVFFALASALSIAWGTVVRHRVAVNTAEGEVPILAALRSPWWWAGLCGALLGYLLQIVALRFGTLLLVQPLLVLSLMFTLPLAHKMNGRQIHKAETGWAALLTVAVAVLVILGRPASSGVVPTAPRWWWSFCLGAVVIGATYFFARRQLATTRAVLLGAVTGAIMGYLALMSKAVVDAYALRGVMGLLGSWELYALLALAGIGTAVQQASFNAGALKNSLPAMTIVEPLVAFSLGYAVLRERFQVDTSLGWFAMGFAFAAMIGSTVALSRLSAEEDAPREG